MFALNDSEDEDFITPNNGSRLSNIFGTTMVQPPGSDHNVSLKYVPPKQPDKSKSLDNVVPRKKESENVIPSTAAKAAFDCLVAKPVFAHQLVNQSYTLKGKFGCALVKSSNPLQYKLILYNAQKKTMSSSRITENFVLIIQGNKYISFYDDQQINWSIMFSNSNDYDEFLKVCESNNILMKHQVPLSSDTSILSQTISETPEDTSYTSVSEEQNTGDSAKIQEKEIDKKEPIKDDQLKSDIVSRMAKMGQAILLPKQIPLETNSDSSETDMDETENSERSKPQIPQRYKSVKPSPVARKLSTNKIKTDMGTNMGIVSMSSNTVMPSGTYFTLINGQLLPVSPAGDQMALTQPYLQRSNAYFNEISRHDMDITNTLSKLTDNLVKLSDRIENITEIKNSTPNAISEKSFEFTADIYKKLLSEYESKIAMKDREIEKLQNLIKKDSQNSSIHIFSEAKTYNKEDCHCQKSTEQNDYIEKMKDLERECERNKIDYILEEKAVHLKTISDLKSELQKKTEEYVMKQTENIDCHKRIRDLETKLKRNEEEYTLKENELKETLHEKNKLNNMEINKLKEIEKINSELSFANKTLQSRVNILEEENEIIRLESNDKRIGDSEFDMKIKTFMNQTYKNLISQFESEEVYSANNVRIVIANTIKETTLSLLVDN